MSDYSTTSSTRKRSWLITTAAILLLSGCAHRPVCPQNHAPSALLQEPRTSYLLSEESRDVPLSQFVDDATADLIILRALQDWAR